jgi:hypothetical protein
MRVHLNGSVKVTNTHTGTNKLGRRWNEASKRWKGDEGVGKTIGLPSSYADFSDSLHGCPRTILSTETRLLHRDGKRSCMLQYRSTGCLDLQQPRPFHTISKEITKLTQGM